MSESEGTREAARTVFGRAGAAVLELAGASVQRRGPRIVFEMSPPLWSRAADFASRHRLSGVALHSAQAAGLAIPEPAVSRFRATLLSVALGTEVAMTQVSELLRVLQELSIPCIFLKGIHLSFGVYDRPTYRSFGDIDLLVHEADATLLEISLLREGYRHSGTDAPPLNGKHLNPLFRRGRFPVEIHTKLLGKTSAPRGQPMLDQVWERSRLLAIGESQVHVMAPEDLLVHLAVHLSAEHRFFCDLSHLLDFCAIAQRWGDTLDLSYIAELSPLRAYTHHLSLAVAMAERFFGMPMALTGALRTASHEARTRYACAGLTWFDRRRLPVDGRLLQVLSATSVATKLRLLTEALAPSPGASGAPATDPCFAAKVLFSSRRFRHLLLVAGRLLLLTISHPHTLSEFVAIRSSNSELVPNGPNQSGRG
ncbi:MAG TPA: nucleotidyltransferase family protein [Spirochaetia bacterium]|nr:nucleotidyltransferase family protein [Spirochaetia bacterium]